MEDREVLRLVPCVPDLVADGRKIGDHLVVDLHPEQSTLVQSYQITSCYCLRLDGYIFFIITSERSEEVNHKIFSKVDLHHSYHWPVVQEQILLCKVIEIVLARCAHLHAV